MYIKKGVFSIREAKVEDAEILASWWNDGKVMAHAGFPNGLGITVERVVENITDKSRKSYLHIIEIDNMSIGEMVYRDLGENVATIGIKICDFSMQNKGYGTQLLSMFINSLFNDLGYEKIVVDTNENNGRARYVYEKLGFKLVRVNKDAWKDQNGVLQSTAEYELLKSDFIDFCADF